MLELLLAAALLGAEPTSVEPPPLGSIVVLSGGAKLVAAATGSDVSHVALVLPGGPAPLIYEATPDQVRSSNWNAFLEEVGELNAGRRAGRRIDVSVMTPLRPLSEGELDAARSFAADQLGRRYSVRGFVRGSPGAGLHCAEFAAIALQRTGRCYFQEPHKLSPQAFLEEVAGYYSAPAKVEAPRPVAPRSWGRRQQKRLSDGWNWSLWAVSETWSWCW